MRFCFEASTSIGVLGGGAVFGGGGILDAPFEEFIQRLLFTHFPLWLRCGSVYWWSLRWGGRFLWISRRAVIVKVLLDRIDYVLAEMGHRSSCEDERRKLIHLLLPYEDRSFLDQSWC